MNEEFRAKLADDLERSGFGSEMRAMREFINRNWSTTGGDHYFDKDGKQTREIDISAYRFLSTALQNARILRCWYHIVAEVKKTDKPWIVFKATPRLGQGLDAWNNLVAAPGLPFHKSILAGTIAEHSLVRELGWLGYGIHESFKKPDAPSRWYSSFLASSKAAVDVFEANVDAEPEADGPVGNIECNFVKPVVILDGPLFSATLSDMDSLELDEIQFAPFNFGYRSGEYAERSYRVDVVQLSSLAEYISLSEKRQQAIVDAFAAIPEEQWNAKAHAEFEGYDLE